MERVKHLAYGLFLFAVNAVSLTGGLLLRRKWKTVVWLSAGLVLLALLDWLSAKLPGLLPAEDSVVFVEYPWLFYVHLSYLLIVVVVVGFFSLTIFRRQPVSHAPISVIVWSLALSVMALVSTYRTFPHALWYVRTDINQGGFQYVKAGSPKEYELMSFHKDITLKDPALWGTPTFVVPSGEQEITGVVRFQGLPAVTSVELYLNGHWRTRTVRTDKNGRFFFKVAPRAPEVNRIRLDYWFSRPDDGRDYVPILVKPALKFNDAFFDAASYQDRIRISSDKTRTHADIEIEIVPFIDMLWPKLREGEQQGSPERTSLAWSPVAHAAFYQVVISEYRDKGTGAPLLTLRVKDNTIPVSALPLKQSSTLASYYVDVSAFDDKERFIGASKRSFGRMRFSLPGYEIVGNIAQDLKCD